MAALRLAGVKLKIFGLQKIGQNDRFAGHLSVLN